MQCLKVFSKAEQAQQEKHAASHMKRRKSWTNVMMPAGSKESDRLDKFSYVKSVSDIRHPSHRR